MTSLFVILALAQPPVLNVAAHYPPAESHHHKKCCECCGENCTCLGCECGFIYTDYVVAAKQAVKQRIPLVVFVGQRGVAVPNAIVLQVKTFQDAPMRGVVVAVPSSDPFYSNSGLARVKDFDGMPSLESVTAAFKVPVNAVQTVSHASPVYYPAYAVQQQAFNASFGGFSGGGCSSCSGGRGGGRR
jgi:hypothetical protein